MTAQAISRRDLMCQCLAAGGLLCAAGMASERETHPLFFQAHGMRVPLARDFPGALKQAAGLGFQGIELCSFPGWAGDTLTGDFGALADWKPSDIRRAIDHAGMTAPSCHFKSAELMPDRLDRSIEWAHAVGVHHMVAIDAGGRPATLDDWKQCFERLNQWGERVRQAGMQLGLHATGDIWKRIDGRRIFDEMLRAVDPVNCQYQMELSVAFGSGVDGGAWMADHPGRFFSVHLRDAVKPAPTGKPDPLGGYLFAVPLGTGEIDIQGALDGARKGGIRLYIVEMEMRPPSDPLEALKLSMEYLRKECAHCWTKVIPPGGSRRNKEKSL